VKKREALQFDQRALPREAVSLPVLVEAHGRQYSARLANLSRIGAMIETNDSLPPGTNVKFQCGTIDTRATVIWVATGLPARAGLKFVAPVDEADVTYQITRSTAAADRRERRRLESAEARGPDHHQAAGLPALKQPD
jgi:hypothetical protein